MHLEKFLYIYKMPSTKRSGNLEQLGILETKDVTEWVNSFVIVEKKAPSQFLQDSNQLQQQSRTTQRS